MPIIFAGLVFSPSGCVSTIICTGTLSLSGDSCIPVVGKRENVSTTSCLMHPDGQLWVQTLVIIGANSSVLACRPSFPVFTLVELFVVRWDHKLLSFGIWSHQRTAHVTAEPSLCIMVYGFSALFKDHDQYLMVLDGVSECWFSKTHPACLYGFSFERIPSFRSWYSSIHGDDNRSSSVLSTLMSVSVSLSKWKKCSISNLGLSSAASMICT